MSPTGHHMHNRNLHTVARTIIALSSHGDHLLWNESAGGSCTYSGFMKVLRIYVIENTFSHDLNFLWLSKVLHRASLYNPAILLPLHNLKSFSLLCILHNVNVQFLFWTTMPQIDILPTSQVWGHEISTWCAHWDVLFTCLCTLQGVWEQFSLRRTYWKRMRIFR